MIEAASISETRERSSGRRGGGTRAPGHGVKAQGLGEEQAATPGEPLTFLWPPRRIREEPSTDASAHGPDRAVAKGQPRLESVPRAEKRHGARQGFRAAGRGPPRPSCQRPGGQLWLGYLPLSVFCSWSKLVP